MEFLDVRRPRLVIRTATRRGGCASCRACAVPFRVPLPHQGVCPAGQCRPGPNAGARMRANDAASASGDSWPPPRRTGGGIHIHHRIALRLSPTPTSQVRRTITPIGRTRSSQRAERATTILPVSSAFGSSRNSARTVTCQRTSGWLRTATSCSAHPHLFAPL